MSATYTQNLTRKVAIVTGSSRGIGAAIALRLASDGADVVINYHSKADAAELIAQQARDLGVKALCVKADVSKKPEIEALFAAAKKELGRVDIVMSNSGIEHFGPVADVTEEDFDKVFDINVKEQFFVAQEASKHLEDNGRLMLISSISAVMGFADHCVYGASKAAIQGMVRSLAWDLGKRNITVNAIAPGGIKSDMWAENATKYAPSIDPEHIDESVAKWSPLGRCGLPDDVAGVVALMASPESQWMTGQTFNVGGGAYMI